MIYNAANIRNQDAEAQLQKNYVWHFHYRAEDGNGGRSDGWKNMVMLTSQQWWQELVLMADQWWQEIKIEADEQQWHELITVPVQQRLQYMVMVAGIQR